MLFEGWPPIDQLSKEVVHGWGHSCPRQGSANGQGAPCSGAPHREFAVSIMSNGFPCPVLSQVFLPNKPLHCSFQLNISFWKMAPSLLPICSSHTTSMLFPRADSPASIFCVGHALCLEPASARSYTAHILMASSTSPSFSDGPSSLRTWAASHTHPTPAPCFIFLYSISHH